MSDEQKHAVEHAQKVLRAVKLYDLAASLGATQGADARPVAWQYKVAGRIELHSHQLDHFYFINGSYVKGTPLYAIRDAAPSDAIGWKLAMRVMQSDLYTTLDDSERAECDALIRANPYIAASAPMEETS